MGVLKRFGMRLRLRALERRLHEFTRGLSWCGSLSPVFYFLVNCYHKLAATGEDARSWRWIAPVLHADRQMPQP